MLFLTSLAAHGCATMHAGSNSIRDQTLVKPPAAAGVSPLKTVSTQPGQDSKTLEFETESKVHFGEASWYGPGFHGKLTASGEVFDENEFTAAHKTLPLGARVRVTNLKNGNTVDVAINDRGPFVDGRIIDLSKAAAKTLGIIHEGITRVKLELIDEATLSRR
jgi:rare lipoprotein A